MSKWKTMSKQSRGGFVNYGIVIIFFIIVQIFSATGHIGSSLSGQLVPICAYVIMALSLNLVVGISGELSLGHAGFMSVGAFTAAVVSGSLASSVTFAPLRLLLAILVAVVLAAVAGFLIGIPVLRLQGDYLAIVTLAFGEIIKNVMNCLYVGVDSKGLHFSLTDANALNLDESGSVLINGPIGATGIVKISTFFAGIVMVLITLFVIQNLVNSRSGRAIMAIRDNRIAAEASGLNITKYKLMAFVTSAALAGAAGALYALNYSTIIPKKFDFNTSILVLVFVVLGGIGNMRGSMIAATILVILPEILRAFSDFRMLVYAVVLIVVMIATNNEKGKILLKKLFGLFRKKKEAV